jgi:hypothetical protein
MFSEIDDLLVNPDILTSPVTFRERRNPADDFEWAAGITDWSCSEAALSFPEFDMAGLAFADLNGALEIPKSAPAYPMPVLGAQRQLPKSRKFRSAVPCIFQPFTSFAATEQTVSQLRTSLRDRELRQKGNILDL